MASLPLVARAEELRGLTEALVRCRSGQGGLILVSGEAGIGKTRLVDEATGSWDGALLRTTVAPSGAAYSPLTKLAPPGEWSPDVEPGQQVVNAFVALADARPTLLLLEDLHWADAATIELLPELADAASTRTLLVLGTYRSDELPRGHALRAARTELRRRNLLTDLSLRPLNESGTRELIAAVLGSAPAPALVSAVQDRSDGLPFFVEELARSLKEHDAVRLGVGGAELTPDAALPVPETVFDAVMARTAGQREQHAEAVEYAAVLGPHVNLAALEEVVGAAEVDALLEAGLLREAGAETAAFRHALVCDALHRSIPWARRRSCHARAAEVLASRQASPREVADHWLAAHEPDRARPLLLESAERDCEAHAYRDAADSARRALAIWPADVDPDARLGLLERLAECVEMSGDQVEAAGTWSEAAAVHRAAGRTERAAQAHRRAANAADLAGDAGRAHAERLSAAEAFAESGAPAEAAVERLTVAQRLKSAGQLSASLEHAVSATASAEAAQRNDLLALALSFEGAVRAGMGDADRGVELARKGVELAFAERLDEVAGEVYYEFAASLEYAADYAGAVSAYESAADLCRRHDNIEMEQVCLVCTSPVTRLMGEWDRALAICAEIHADLAAPAFAHRVADEESGLIAALRGDRRTARPRVRRAAEFGRENGIFGLEVGARWGLAVVATLEDDVDAALSAVANLVDLCALSEECHYALPSLRWSATLLTAVGESDRLTQAHRIVAGLATRNATPKVLSTLAHVGAELALLEGDDAQSEELFGRSMELLAGITAPYEQAHTGLRWGEAADRLERRDEAVERVMTAYRIAQRLGAKPLALRCATALSDLGEPVGRRLGRLAARSLDRAGLTRRELEVLNHLAAGQTNKAIAADLVLSTRTVDMHVRNLMEKLDCSTRGAAVRRAAERGLVALGG